MNSEFYKEILKAGPPEEHIWSQGYKEYLKQMANSEMIEMSYDGPIYLNNELTIIND